MPVDKGLTLFEFLECRGHSEEEIKRLADEGRLIHNGDVAELDMLIKISDKVSIDHRRYEGSTYKTPPILYEDDSMIAYDKPSEYMVVADRANLHTGLLGHLRDQNGTPAGPPYLVHRLDKGTSGVWVVAKTVEAKKSLTDQFANNKVKKQYRAIVQGTFFDKEGEIDVPIDKHPKHPTKMITGKGKEAHSRYKVLRQYRHYATVRVWPTTGRTHQIRLHLKYLGHPLLVDDFYGGYKEFFLSKIKSDYKKSKKRAEKPLISRLTLHCESMELLSPSLGSTIKIESPLPKDLARLERNLQNYD